MSGSAGPGQNFASHIDISAHLPSALALIFLGGVLTSLTPCVYPLIPITVGIFGARHAERRSKAAALSATYVLGIASMYSSLGVVAALTGRAFGQTLGNPWVVIPVALLFTALAASLFGAFKLALPSALTARLTKRRGAGFTSAFVMGMVAGIVAAPCTGPVLGGVLAWVAGKRNVALGVMLLFDYALGMGLLFFLIGTFSLALPRSGRWMEIVESFFGVAILAVAVSYVRPFLPASPAFFSAHTLAIAAGALVFLGIAAGAMDLSFHGERREKIIKAAALTLLLAGVGLQLGWFGEARMPRIAWRHEETAALSEARAHHAPVLIDFYADWCVACVELDKHTFTDAAVQAEAERFVTLKVDGTSGSEAFDALQTKYGVTGMPTVVFLDSNGNPLEKNRVTGFLPPDQFLSIMRAVR